MSVTKRSKSRIMMAMVLAFVMILVILRAGFYLFEVDNWSSADYLLQIFVLLVVFKVVWGSKNELKTSV